MSALGGIKQSREGQDVGAATSPSREHGRRRWQLGMSRSGSPEERQQSEPGMRHRRGMALPNSSVTPRGGTEGKGAFPTPTQEDEWC